MVGTMQLYNGVILVIRKAKIDVTEFCRSKNLRIFKIMPIFSQRLRAKLHKERAEFFHRITAQMLCVAQRGRPNIWTAVSFLTKSRLGLASFFPHELLWYLRTATHSKTDYEETLFGCRNFVG